MKQIAIEGYAADEILNLPDEQLDGFVLCGKPIVFRAGSTAPNPILSSDE